LLASSDIREVLAVTYTRSAALLPRTAIRLWGNLSKYTRTATRSHSKDCTLIELQVVLHSLNPRGGSRRRAFPRKTVLSGPLDEALNQQGDSHEIYEVEGELPILHYGLTSRVP
jgi:hypothetical protein